jgi:NADP-dependent 3-hydroxy acid dehydrogenase YdfG
MNEFVLITGASSGFGEAIAKIFAKNKWNVILTGRRLERLQKVHQELKPFGVEVFILNFDVRNENEVQQAVASLPTEVSSKIHILVNNAGLALGRDPIDKGQSEDWDQMIDTNVKGLLYVTKAVVPFLKANQAGHIVNLSSIAGKEVYAMGNVYCASKHAVDALSKAMRIDLLPYNIRVTNIAPGAAETEFSEVRYKGDKAQADATYSGYEPLVAVDIADAVYYVCTTPKHVCINDLVIMPTAQANATTLIKK